VDTVRIERYFAQLNKLREQSPEALKKGLEIVKRVAAVDTGAIEGLYETDRGFTFTVALQAAHWEAAIAGKGKNVRQLFESQLSAYDYVLDFATGEVPVAEAWIRKLHAEICGSQQTYQVWTEIGLQEQEMPKGEYKRLPNHVIRADGKIHPHAPVEMTPAEMHRLCEELRGEPFLAAHPILQAAYSHYALVVIHPFADGNGRVARALASAYTYRAWSVPVLVMVDNRTAYLSALAEADVGSYQQFVDVILERTLDAMQLVAVSLRSAMFPQLEDSVDRLTHVYLTKGGYTQASVDAAGHQFFTLFKEEMTRVAKGAAETGPFSFANYDSGEVKRAEKSGYRSPAAPQSWSFKLTSSPPTVFEREDSFTLEVPNDCGREDEIIIRWINRGEELQARVTELTPIPTTALQMRISIWVRGILGWTIDQLSRHAAELRG